MRPERLVVVAGTGTEIGKTYVAVKVAESLRDAGVTVAARKPAQSFVPGERTDAHLLAAATGEDPHGVCPAHRWYEVPMAPPMAAAALGRTPFTIADLTAEIDTSWPTPPAAVGLVELAGGPRSPIAADGDGADLASAIDPDVSVLVADAGLGTINAVRLSASVLPPVWVLLNRYDETEDLHARNASWLRDHGFAVMTDPRVLAAAIRVGESPST